MNENSKRYITFIVIYILALPFGVLAQNTNNSFADSLRLEIESKTGIEKITLQLDLATMLYEIDNTQAKAIAQAALNAAKKNGNKLLQMRSYFLVGRINRVVLSIDAAQSYLDTALFISEDLDDNYFKSEILLRKGINQYTKGEHVLALESYSEAIKAGLLSEHYKNVGACYSAMGTIFRINGLYDRAIEYIVKSKSNYQKAQFIEGYAWSNYLLGLIYRDLKLNEKALESFEQALVIYIPMASKDQNKNGLAICYEQIGMINLDMNRLEEARSNIEKVLEIHTESGSKFGIASAFSIIGQIEYASGNYKIALNYLNNSLSIKKEMGDLITQSIIYEYIGISLIRLGQTTKGLQTMQKALDLAVLNNQKKVQFDICTKLADTYHELNNFRKAIEFQKQQIEIQRAMLLGGASIKIEQLQDIYEIDAKNSQIAELKKQNEINTLEIKQQRTWTFVMVVGIVLILVVAIIILGFYRKIRKKNEQLYEANASKNRFFAIIAHDLRGPTQSLTSFLELMNSQFDAFSKNKLKEVLQTLYESSEKVSTLLDNLLTWAQTQVDKIEYNPTQLNLCDMLHSSYDSLKHQADKKQISVNIEPDTNVSVIADSNMLQTIIRNLLSNAIKFTPRKGSVNLKTEIEKNNKVAIKITDTGVGIEKEVLAKIFDISNTHHSLGTENEKSSGLGLILVKDFVEKNYGTINIESQKNHGTTVTFTLPLA